MNWNEFDFNPVFGEKLTVKNTLPLDFSAANLSLQTLDLGDTALFEKYVFAQLNRSGKTYGIGGYLEKRAIYRRSEVFGISDKNFRDIHLGIDIWTQAGTPIYVPFPGSVHSFQDNVGFGDYGPTIILSHDLDGKRLFTLYGHLCRTDLEKLYVGKHVQAGGLLCHVGPYPENGDWPAHLHFQLIWDLGEYVFDYPGVAAESDLDFYKENCPDPDLILRIQH
jgi:murein DD-endopeptidase MepM/ murein hydrolase activator NlpD